MRPRHGKEKTVNKEVVVTSKKKLTDHLHTNADPIATLKAGVKTVRHHTRGWLKQDPISSGTLVDEKDAIQEKVWADYNAQLIHVRAQKDILGVEYNPLRTVLGRDDDGKFSFSKK